MFSLIFQHFRFTIFDTARVLQKCQLCIVNKKMPSKCSYFTKIRRCLYKNVK